MNKKYKYTIITQIIEHTYECVHEICNPDPDVEYLLFSYDKEIKSNTWNIIYVDSTNQQNIFNEPYKIRFNPFLYCHSDICIQITGNIMICKSLDILVNDFLKSNSDIGVMLHPCFQTFMPELQLWYNIRNYPIENIQRFLKMLNDSNYDLNFKGYYQLAFMIQKKTKTTNDINNLTYSFMKYLGTENNIERHDQLVMSYVLNTFFRGINIFLMHPQIVESKYMKRYKHNSHSIQESLCGNIPYNVNMPFYGWCQNKQQQAYFLK